jgi:hypothetical protein
MVSVGVFAIVMTLASGAYLMMLRLSNNAQGVTTSVNSVSFALEYVTREIRTGTAYTCSVAYSAPPIAAVTDCASGGAEISVTDQYTKVVTFYSAQVSGSTNYGIYKSVDGVASLLTDPSINVSTLTFYVAGTKPYSNGSDITPAHVTIVAAGTMISGKSTLPFNIETGAVMRNPDL